MTLRTSIVSQVAILVGQAAISAVYYSRLPDQVPTHWNIHGQADQFGSKLVPVLMGPAMVLFGLLLTVSLPKLSPKKFEIEKFAGTYAYVMVLISALFCFLSIVTLRATTGGKFDIGGMFTGGMFVFFALLGNVLGKVRRNFYMGIRTPWTLASEQVWDATHRLAGRIWFVGGLIGAAMSFLGLPIMGSIVLLLVISMWPVFQSYFIYKRLEG